MCSARDCPAAASWLIVWRNPKIHATDREKVWAACDEHKDHLADFLAARSFLKRIEPWRGGR